MQFKKVLTALIMFTALIVSGCFSTNNGLSDDKGSGVTLERGEDRIVVKANEAFSGAEFEISTAVDSQYIVTEVDKLKLIKRENGKTYINLVDMDSEVTPGEKIFEIRNCQEKVEVKVLNSITENNYDKAIDKLYKDTVKKGVRAGTTDELLGDFDADKYVSITDLISFIANYQTTNSTYDIAPATKGTVDPYVGIYSKKTPDGIVDLFDFMVFAKNYGKKINNQATVSSVALSGPATVEEGSNISITAAVTYSDGNVKSEVVNWSTSDDKIASLTANGASATVTGVVAGTVTIKAEKDSKIGELSVTVTKKGQVALSSIDVTGDQIVEIGKTVSLAASGIYADGTTGTLSSVTWTSSDATKATVSSTGVVTGIAGGTVKIYASNSGIKTERTVVVKAAVTDIKVHYYTTTFTPTCYAWDPSTVKYSAGWPGDQMTADSVTGWYSYTISSSKLSGKTSTNIIFSNAGSGQTADLSRTLGEWWYKDNTWSAVDPSLDIAAPEIAATPAAGKLEETTKTITLKVTDNKDTAAKVYYTVDGTTPTTASTLYSNGITITKNCTIKAIAVDASGNISRVYVLPYELGCDVTPPVITPSVTPGRFDTTQSVKLSAVDAKDGAVTIYYSVDGTTPRAELLYMYNGQTLTISSTTTVRALAVDKAGNKSEESFRYTIGNAASRDFREESIYFVITPRFMDGDPSNNVHCWDDKQAGNPDSDPAWRGDFKGLTEKLDYIKALGFTAIWVTPPVKNISGYDYHGYHAVNFKEIDPRYKTKYDTSAEESYQKFIDAAHAKGMKVIQDIVLNHSGNFGEENIFPMFKRKTVDPYMNETINDVIEKIAPEGRLPANYDTLLPGYQYAARINAMKEDSADTQKIYHHEKTLSWESYTVQTGQIAGDCVDLNTENPAVSKYLTEAYNKYIDMGVDAFRIDTVKHVSRLTFNKEFNPAFKARGGKDFYMFGEVCTRYHGVWNSGIPAISAPFYTWAENKEYPWSTLEERVASVAANYNDNINTGAQRKSENARLIGNDYHIPDYSQASNLNVIDFPMHWAFKEAKSAFTQASSEDDKYYNDSTWNVTYVDSHDYAPDGAPENQRFAGSQITWAENLDLLFTFRGIPCILYGSEIEFMKGSVIDVGPNAPLSETGRAYFGDNLDGKVTATDFAKYSATGKVSETLSYPLSKHIQRLNLLRRELPALQKGQYSLEGVSGNIAFKRRYTDTTKGIDNFVLVTISGTATFTGIPNGTYTDAITGKSVAVSAGTLTADCTGQGNMRIYVLNGTGKIGEDGVYLK